MRRYLAATSYTTLILACVLGWVTSLATTAERPLERHFIVLVRASGDDMGRKQRSRIPNLLQDGLFGKRYGGEFVFNPAHDRMSLGFYSITDSPSGDPAACKQQQPGADGEHSGRVLAAQYIFDWDRIDWAPSPSEFADVLAAELGKACRFQERRAPESVIWMLALPDISKRLTLAATRSQQFDQVIIVDVGITAAFGDPSTEIDEYRQRWGYDGTDRAAEDTQRVQKYFRLGEIRKLVQPSSGGSRSPTLAPGPEQDRYLESAARGFSKEYPLYLLFRRVLPALAPPELLMDMPGRIVIEPGAISARQVATSAQPTAGPSIRRQEQWMLQEVAWIADEGGSTPLIGPDGTALRTRTLPALHCNQPVCLDSADRWIFPLWAGFGLPAQLDAQKAELASGRAAFSAAFAYNTGGVYDHLLYRTTPRSIEVATRPSPVVRSGIFPARPVDSPALVAQWHSGDGQLTLDTAVARIQGSREVWTWVAILLIVLLASGALALLWYLLPGCEFRPSFQWRPSSNPMALDFNATGNQVVLLGTLVLVNTGRPGRASALVHKTEQPRRPLRLELSPRPFANSGFMVDDESADAVIVGLARNGPQGDEPARATCAALTRHWQGRAVDGQEFLVFLARERVKDFNGVADRGSVTVRMQVPLAAYWCRRWSSRFDNLVESTLELCFEAKPKEPARPQVTYLRSDSPAYYARGLDESDSTERVVLGAYVFESPEQLKFARTFEGTFELATQVAGRPVTNEAVGLASGRVHLGPGAKLTNAVVVHCASSQISNPEPPSHAVVFHCLGPAAPDSDLAPKRVELFRDRAQAGLDLTVNPHWPGEREIYWGNDGGVRWRLCETGAEAEQAAAERSISLEEQLVHFKRGAETPIPITTLQLQNAARNGRGRVEVEVATRIRCAPEVRRLLRDRDDRPLDPESLIEVVEGEHASRPVRELELTEGARRRLLEVNFRTARIYEVVDGRITADKVSVIVDIKARVWTDADVIARRPAPSGIHECSLVIPLRIELLPPDTWLCIDFGTSAITVARKDSSGGRLVVSDLQKVEQHSKGRTNWCFAKYDRDNPEVNTPFLPSAVVFDADLRQDAAKGHGYPGFPEFAPASLVPGDASFVSLPARRSADSNREGRVVYSLKSWFASGSDRILLDTPIATRATDGAEVSRTRELRTRDAMVSTLAALAEAYIGPDKADAGRIVLTHPNTLTSIHIEEFLDIARTALAARLGVPLHDRISVVSESDAVAYYYVDQLRAANPPVIDTLLVYDFGAGTLDLSVIRIEWEWTPGPQPKSWRTLARLGVPLAGNHIDMLIARIVHKVLTDPQQIDQSAWNYQFPIVGNSLAADSQYHREAILNGLWPSIREAKHRISKGQARFTESEFVIPLRLDELGRREGGIVVPISGVEPDPTKRAVRLEKDRRDGHSTVIGIPTQTLFEDPGMLQFQDFVTREVIQEALRSAGLQAEEVTSVVVSGRGALWPGLRDAVCRQFPAAEKPDLMHDGSSNRMKNAVAEGAIEFQRINKGRQLERDDSTARPRLVVVLMKNQRYQVLDETEWHGKAINVQGIHRGDIYQVAHSEPRAQDFQGYRRFFYARVPASWEVFDESFAVNGQIRLTREDTANGGYTIRAENGARGFRRFGQHSSRLDPKANRPDWPVGSVQIPPEGVD